jgi:phenylacetic acid degradation operon negative regulatory protein
VRPSARSLILDLLSTLRDGTMPVGALVASAELFGISGNNLRVALARLLAEGRVMRDERGRYALGPAAKAVSRRLAGWRHPERALRPWDGRWVGVRLAPGGPRRDRRGRERALRLLGFERLESDLAIRPHNLRMTTAELRDELRMLGLPDGDLVFTLDDLDEATEGRARALWRVDAIRGAHREIGARIAKSARRIASAPIEKAMVESFVTGGEGIQRLVLDPLLPEEICPAAERDALVTAMREYDKAGRSAWASFMAQYGVPHRGSAIDTRLVEERVAAAW